MYFVVTRHDKPASLELRLSERPRHLDYLERVLDKIVYGGALLDAQGKQNGSILIIDVADREAAEAFAQADPYVDVGLFQESSIEPFRPVFRDGSWLR
ncbi:MAG TPA: YciI family protein [Rhodopila sp.]|uniref:YciI family protein n=1 Tax=Rhodopila sp. TaxID=2480087 RepID=UPI002BAF2FBB|nr:YciI family protein [Rhodopila sp.]HVY13840.1 YciI family protein [Rhodopila sp.]